MSAFDDACEYAEELGIPEDQIDDVVASAELCCEGPYGEGVCAENTKFIIEAAAKRFDAEREAEMKRMHSLYKAEVHYGIHIPEGREDDN